ncbi:hypothetical protein [Aeromonas salmonicida]|uniref:hypothetical protein n=1 Tax=Aeromonas salmonicida TaxID=645 RepID=UPI003D025194
MHRRGQEGRDDGTFPERRAPSPDKGGAGWDLATLYDDSPSQRPNIFWLPARFSSIIGHPDPARG